MNSKQYELAILVNNKPIKEYCHNGDIYVEGRVGSEYSIRVKNNQYKRIMTVITIDGINVITGDVNNEQGYIINGYNSSNIKGFLINNKEMGAFKFCDKSNSYCNEKGLKGNNGVIGVKIFTEKQYLPIYINQFNKYDNIYIPHPPVDPIPSPQYPRDIPMISDVPYNGSNFDKTVTCSSYTSHACTNNTPDFNVGTTWGQKLNESTVEVSFEPDYVDSEMVIYYASKKSLQKLGINFDNKIKKIYKPKAFPQYAIPPKNWNG